MGDALPEMSFLDERERGLVENVLAVVAAADPGRAAWLARGLEWLGRCAGLVSACPALTLCDRQQAAAAIDGLVDALASGSEHDFELHGPTKAVLGQAYLVAKINFIDALDTAARASGGPPELLARIGHELGQSIYSRLAEELLIAVVTDRAAERFVKRRAGEVLCRVWEHRLATEIDDFAPFLESAWEARNKVKPVLGTMLGSHEVFRLFQEARDERFLDYFVDDDVAREQTEAFEEFLFGLAHEDIARLRAHLGELGRAAISAEDAVAILGGDAPADGDGPAALYASYKRRKLKSDYRTLTGAPGPKHTAEEYVMVSFLRRPSVRFG